MTSAEPARAVVRAERAWYYEDWVNPVLLKEVRQALRGRYFKTCFWITLVAVTVVTSGMLVSMGADGKIGPSEGRIFVSGIYGCLAIAVLGLVPFSAFNAMGAEWDENTFDLLIISNVRPRGIVLGKLLATGIQTLLFYSAFTPYFVLASLMQGIDLNAVAVVLVGTGVFSLVLTLVALCLSTLSRVRFARVVLMAALSAVLMFGTSAAIAAAQMLIQEPGMLQDREIPYVILSIAVPHLIVGAYAAGIACVMLSHSEENRSTGLRILTSLCTLGALAWIYAMTNVVPAEGTAAMGIGLLCALLIPCLFFATEPERLPRRVEHHLPTPPAWAILASPYLPGGARGFLYLLLHLGLVSAGILFIRSYKGALSVLQLDEGGLSFLAALLYFLIYLGLPSALCAPFTNHVALRSAARALVPFAIGGFAFFPAVLGFFLDDARLMRLQHPGNPMYLIERSWDGFSGEDSMWVLLTTLALVAVLCNLPRSLRAWREAWNASRARADRAAVAQRASDAAA